MDHAAFIDLHELDDEAKKELKTFIEFLTFKGKIKKKGIKSPRRKKLTFKTLSLDTSGFKFSREEANER
jgi:hypothetical protein